MLYFVLVLFRLECLIGCYQNKADKITGAGWPPVDQVIVHSVDRL